MQKKFHSRINHAMPRLWLSNVCPKPRLIRSLALSRLFHVTQPRPLF